MPMSFQWEAYKYVIVMVVLAIMILAGSYLSYLYRRKKVAQYMGVEDIPLYSEMDFPVCNSFLCDFWLINRAVQVEESNLISAWLITWFGQGKIRLVDGTDTILLEENLERESFAEGDIEYELFQFFGDAAQGQALQASDVTAWINQNDKTIHDWLSRLYREGESRAIDLGYVAPIHGICVNSFSLTEAGKGRLQRFASFLLYIKDYAASWELESTQELYIMLANLAFLQIREDYRSIFLRKRCDDNEAMALWDRVNAIEHFGRAVGGYLAAERSLQLQRSAGEFLLSSDLRKGFAEAVDSKLFFVDTTENLLQRATSSRGMA